MYLKVFLYLQLTLGIFLPCMAKRAGCSVEFGAPGFELQKLNPCNGYDDDGQCICPSVPCAARGTFVGLVLMGYGKYCDDARRLQQDTDELVVVELTGEPFLITTGEEEPEEEEPIATNTTTKCSDNWFLGLLQVILGWLYWLLGLDPFCQW